MDEKSKQNAELEQSDALTSPNANDATEASVNNTDIDGTNVKTTNAADTSTSNISAEIKTSKAYPQPPKYLEAERPVFFDWALGFATFGLSSIFWLFTSVKRLKQINNNPERKPWMWIFVPFVMLPQLFALPKLLGDIEEAEEKLELTPWNKLQNAVWLICVIGLSVITAVLSRTDSHALLQFAVLFLWVVAFFSLAARVNLIFLNAQIKQAKLYGGYSLIEWPILIIGGAFMAFVIWFSGLNILVQGNRVLEDGYQHKDLEKGFAITFYGDDWRQANLGTYSDGSAEVEFSGMSASASLIVFEHNNEDDLSDIAHWRIGNFKDSVSKASCKETRTLIPSTLYLSAYIECKGTLLGEPYYDLYQYIQVGEERYFEIFANFSDVDKKFNKHINKIRRTVHSLKQIEVKKAENELDADADADSEEPLSNITNLDDEETTEVQADAP